MGSALGSVLTRPLIGLRLSRLTPIPHLHPQAGGALPPLMSTRDGRANFKPYGLRILGGWVCGLGAMSARRGRHRRWDGELPRDRAVVGRDAHIRLARYARRRPAPGSSIAHHPRRLGGTIDRLT